MALQDILTDLRINNAKSENIGVSVKKIYSDPG